MKDEAPLRPPPPTPTSQILCQVICLLPHSPALRSGLHFSEGRPGAQGFAGGPRPTGQPWGKEGWATWLLHSDSASWEMLGVAQRAHRGRALVWEEWQSGTSEDELPSERSATSELPG